jgi:tetratricopeptide (TPR) repeat protein
MPLSRLATLTVATYCLTGSLYVLAQTPPFIAPPAATAPINSATEYFSFNPPTPNLNNPFQEATRLLRRGQNDEALSQINLWLTSRPKDARGRFLRGMILTAQKKIPEAIQIYLDLTQDFPELPEPYNNLAALYASQANYEKARSLLETAIIAMPGFSLAHENLGDTYIHLAALQYEKAAKLDSTNKSAPLKLKRATQLLPPPTEAIPVSGN